MPKRLVPLCDLGIGGPATESEEAQCSGRVYDCLSEQEQPLIQLSLDQLSGGHIYTPSFLIEAVRHAVLPLMDREGTPINPAETAQREKHLAIIRLKEAAEVVAMAGKFTNVPLGNSIRRYDRGGCPPFFVDPEWLKAELTKGGLYKALWDNPYTGEQEEVYLFRTTGDEKRPTGFVTEKEMEGVEGWEVLAA